MKKFLSVAIAISLIGCATGGPKQTGGTLIGGVAGALAGAQFGKGSGQLVGVALGALIGSQIGASIGQSMDEKDKQMVAQSAYSGLENQPDNSVVTWKNPNNNHSGSFVATNTQQVDSHKVCRDYVQTVMIDGKQDEVHGRACRDLRDVQGQWIVQQ